MQTNVETGTLNPPPFVLPLPTRRDSGSPRVGPNTAHACCDLRLAQQDVLRLQRSESIVWLVLMLSALAVLVLSL
jgi:hypothetical protein